MRWYSDDSGKVCLRSIKKVNMFSCKPISTPLSTSENLSAREGVLLGSKDASCYRSEVGGLQYLAITRPNIYFSLNKVCHFFMYLLIFIGLL
jgi:hypothetical protein